MMSLDEFAAAVGVDDEHRDAAYQMFCAELTAPRKTLAHRSADLADGLRLIGVDETTTYTAVHVLAQERRR